MSGKKYIYKILLALVLAVLIAGCGSGETPQLEKKATDEVNAAETPDAILKGEFAGTSTATAETELENSDVGQSATEELSTEPQQEKTSQISIIMVGDILLHTPVEKAALQEDGSYKFDAIFTNLKEDIQAADLAIVNQEVILGGEELGISGYPAFNAPFTVGDALVEAGFDVVCHGTNHALDKGKKGLLNCISYWKESHPEIGVLGIHDSEESQDNIYIYEQDGIKVAVLNYTYGTNGIALPEDMPYAVDLLTEEKVITDIKKAEELADFTIVCPHWGTEYQLVQSKAQEKWAGIFAEHGVDLVLGTHPHVIQPIAKVTDEESGHEMLVYYSLGNFVNWTSESGAGIANRMVGGMAQVTLERGEDGKVCITEYGVEPVVCHLEQGVNGVTVYKLADYTEELAGENQICLQDNAFSKEYCENLCDEVWSEIAW